MKRHSDWPGQSAHAVAAAVVLVATAALGIAAAKTGGPPAPGAATPVTDAFDPPRAAEPFAPGLVSIPRGQGEFAERPVFSPDGHECWFDVTNYRTKTFTGFHMSRENGAWSKPEAAFFAQSGGTQACVSCDGSTLFFSGPGPANPKVRGIWMCRRKTGAWREPVFLDRSVNGDADVGFPCVVRSGALYFLVFSGPDRGLRRAPRIDGGYPRAEAVPAFQPGPGRVFGDFFVDPDERFIVIYSTLPDNLGQGDLYASFRLQDGSWTPPRNLGPQVNTAGYDFAPSISPDGRALFFTRDQGGTGGVWWIALAALDAFAR